MRAWSILLVLAGSLALACKGGPHPGGNAQASGPSMLGEFELGTSRFGPSDEELESMGRRLLEHPQLAEAIPAEGRLLLGFRLLEVELKNAESQDSEALPPPTHFEAVFYDYVNERTVAVRGDLGLKQALQVEESSAMYPPTEEEYLEALSVLRADGDLGRHLRSGTVETYLAMPGVTEFEELDGSRIRQLVVGFLPKAGAGSTLPPELAATQLYGISIGRRSVKGLDHRELGFLTHHAAHGDACEPPNNAGQATTPRWTSGSANVTVKQSGKVLWTFRVTRPSNSSGTRGSGVELTSLRYKGTKVLHRAHVPILNVHYADDACGPYRDWQHQEGSFQANGTDATSGIRLCPSPAKTIIESGSDQGNFRGVAIWVEGQEVVLASEMEAGWYRYVSRWRLHANGSIRPQFGFAATSNYCTCKRHFHNCYWRLDFDIGGAGGDRIEEFNDPALGSSNWHTKSYERMRYRDASRQRRWRVRDGARSYVLVPGANDGTADAYARGDAWFLRYHGSSEYDDGNNSTGSNTEANISKFDNDESLVNKDVVLWYSAHFDHDAAHSHATGVYLGPVLQPSGF